MLRDHRPRIGKRDSLPESLVHPAPLWHTFASDEDMVQTPQPLLLTMPNFHIGVTMDPSCHIRSTWRDVATKPLTNKAIEDYEREGYYGPDRQAMRKRLDGAKVVQGVLRLPRPCQSCHKNLGHFMRFSYLPRAGYYCEHCRQGFKDEVEDEKARRQRARTLEAFV